MFQMRALLLRLLFKPMSFLGEDFRRAWRGWLYPTETVQIWWRGIFFFCVLIVLDLLLQAVGGIGAYAVLAWKDFPTLVSDLQSQSPELLKAMVLGLFPASLVLIFSVVYFGQFGMRDRQGRLLLRWPKLGLLGWPLLVGGFVGLMIVIFNGTFYVLGIDPSTYSPSGGLGDPTSSAGAVEKTIAELAKNPVLFALALPGVVLAVPVTEELLFRGALFSAIADTRLGRVGAVLITSALWALMHRLSPAPWLFVGVIFVMGLVLGVLLLRFGSLWVTMACHTAWNLMSSLAIFGGSPHS